MGRIAIITARGGSKRIPQKNIKNFCGKPIIAYSIECAIECGCFDEVMVSTDSKEIVEIAVKYGARVPFLRSERTSNDYSTTSDVLFEVLTNYSKLGLEFEYGCCIYPTAPFITNEKLLTGMNRLINSNADTVIPMVEFTYPPQRGFIYSNGRFVMNQPQYINSRSQDLERIYHDSGQFYWFRVESFLRNRNLMSGSVDGIIVSELETQDIDTYEDWKMAELKYSFLQQSVNKA